MSICGMGIETRSLPLRPMSSPCEMYLRRFCRILPRTMARKREWSWSILRDICLESSRSSAAAPTAGWRVDATRQTRFASSAIRASHRHTSAFATIQTRGQRTARRRTRRRPTTRCCASSAAVPSANPPMNGPRALAREGEHRERRCAGSALASRSQRWTPAPSRTRSHSPSGRIASSSACAAAARRRGRERRERERARRSPTSAPATRADGARHLAAALADAPRRRATPSASSATPRSGEVPQKTRDGRRAGVEDAGAVELRVVLGARRGRERRRARQPGRSRRAPSIIAATPATCGDAMLVPLNVPKISHLSLPPLHTVCCVTATPGAAMATSARATRTRRSCPCRRSRSRRRRPGTPPASRRSCRCCPRPRRRATPFDDRVLRPRPRGSGS